MGSCTRLKKAIEQLQKSQEKFPNAVQEFDTENAQKLGMFTVSRELAFHFYRYALPVKSFIFLALADPVCVRVCVCVCVCKWMCVRVCRRPDQGMDLVSVGVTTSY